MFSDATVGALCALGSAMTWSVTSLLVRSLIPVFGTVGINAIRSTLSGALLLLYVVLSGGLGAFTAMSPAAFWLLAVSIVFAIGIGDTVFFEATRSLGLGRAMTISMTYPILAALLAAVFLDEPLTLPVLGGAVLTLAGLVLIVGTRRDPAVSPRFWLGVAGASLASLAWAVSVVMMKLPLREVDPVTAQAIRLPLAAALLWLTPWARGAGTSLRGAGGGALARAGVLSLLTAGSAVMFVAALKYAGVAVASVLSSTAPLFAIPLGFVFLRERLPASAVLGAAVTVAGIVVLQL